MSTKILSQEEFEAVLDSSYDGIHITDGSGKTLYYNKACERIEGNKKEDIIGKDISDLVKSGIYSESIALKALEKKETITMLQEINGKKVMATATPVLKNKKITTVITNSRDITQLNTLQKELEFAKQINEKYHSELELWRSEQLTTDDIIAKDSSMKRIIDLVIRVAKVDSSVLIQGESGVGKGVIASLIHKHSKRREAPFIKIDCGSITESLLESELFGYEKGAFTSASKDGKMGLIEIADGGTLFLDEIGELSLSLQMKLLRVVQDREIVRVGGTKTILVDIRIITATNKDLATMVNEKTFREDLYYRLNIVPILIPPLRERREDIYPLIMKNLEKFSKKYALQKVFSPDAIGILIQFDWPGNVRELENMIERLVVTTPEQTINLTHIPAQLKVDDMNKKLLLNVDTPHTLKESLNRMEKLILLQTIKETRDIFETSKILQIDPSTVRRKLKKHNILNSSLIDD